MKTLKKKFRILKKLEEEGFSVARQDDMSFCCELITRINNVENNYTRTLSLVEGCARSDDKMTESPTVKLGDLPREEQLKRYATLFRYGKSKDIPYDVLV